MTAVGEDTWERLVAVGRPLDPDTLAALSPMLILAPHPDDETLGCGGLIATASRLGLRPHVAYLTDGAASHPGSRAWPRPRLAAQREHEALDALRILGVPRTDVLFLGWPDAAPHEAGSAPYGATLARLLDAQRSGGIRSLWAPWGQESHCDHVAAARLAETLGQAADVIVMSYLVWGWADPELARAARVGEVWMLDCPRTAPLRRRALSCHRTQTTSLISDAGDAFRIPPRLAALTQRPAEVFLQTP